MAMTRLVWAVVAALVLPAVALGGARSYSRYQPSSIAFLDRQHGLLAEEDWSCGKSRGCAAQILVSGDGGTSWRVSYRATMPIRLYPVRGTREVWASTGASVIESGDGGLSWRRVFARPALVSFASPADGWRGAADSTVNHPQPLLATRNGGRSWQTRTNPCRGEFGPLVALSFASPTRGWLSGQGGLADKRWRQALAAPKPRPSDRPTQAWTPARQPARLRLPHRRQLPAGRARLAVGRPRLATHNE
jgi:hypothetical protein